jgi:hypothetical protein
MTLPMTLWGGVTSTDPTQLAPPSLAASSPVDTLTQRSTTVRVSGPPTWPVGVVVDVESRTNGGAWAAAGSSASAVVVVSPRPATGVDTVDVRGRAVDGAPLTDSEWSALATIAVPAALTTVSAGGTPLAWRVRTSPVPSELFSEASGVLPITHALPFRAQGTNAVTVDHIENPAPGTAIVASAVTWRALSADGVVLGTGALTLTGTEWRVSLLPSPSLRLLELSVTAPDASVTTVQYLITLTP